MIEGTVIGAIEETVEIGVIEEREGDQDLLIMARDHRAASRR